MKPRLLSVALPAGIAAFSVFSPVPVMAAYCGSNADTASLQTLALSNGATDVSRIMDIVVVQGYARVDIQSKGRVTEYYVKDCGKWRFSGYAVPADAPTAAATQLRSFVPRDNGGTQCLNPSFVNRPSG
jgi:hypothetical protein